MATSVLSNNQLHFTTDGTATKGGFKVEDGIDGIKFFGPEDEPLLVGNIANPQTGNDVANKSYVDNAVSGLDWLLAVKAHASSNILLTDLKSGITIDGLELALGDRVLLTGQSNKVENGVYVIGVTESQRGTDMPAGGSAYNDAIFVVEGTEYSGRAFVSQSSKDSSVIGVNELSFTQFFTGTIYRGGDGIVVNNDEISVASTVVKRWGSQEIIGAKTFKAQIGAESGVKVPDGEIITLGTTDDTSLKIKHDGTNASLTNDGGDLTIGSSADDTSTKLELATGSNAKVEVVNSSGEPVFTVKETEVELGTSVVLGGIATPSSNDHAVNKGYVDEANQNTLKNTQVKIPADYCFEEHVPLNGLYAGQIYHGVTLIKGDRVLLINQNDKTENGIMEIDDTSANRPNDFPVGQDVSGTLVVVKKGELSEHIFLCKNAGDDGSVVGTDNLVWDLVGKNLSLWKNAVHLLVSDNVDLSGSGGLIPGQIVQGHYISEDDRILLTGQTNPGENGVYIVHGADDFERAEDFSTGESIEGVVLFVSNGTHKGKMYYVKTNKAVVGQAHYYEEFSPKPHDQWKKSVKAAITTHVNIDGLLSVGGVVIGDRVLLTGQNDSKENGIYKVGTTSLSRTDDLAIGSSALGVSVFVLGFNSTYTCILGNVVGTDQLTFIITGTFAKGVSKTLQFQSADVPGSFASVSNFTSDGSNVKIANGGKLFFSDTVLTNFVKFNSSTGRTELSTSGGLKVTTEAAGEIGAYLGDADGTSTYNIKNSSGHKLLEVNSSGLVSVNNRITGIHEPTDSFDAVNKSYLDKATKTENTWKQPVKLVIKDNIKVEQLFKAGIQIGSETLTTGQVVLLVHQTDPSTNGYYSISDNGHTKMGNVDKFVDAQTALKHSLKNNVVLGQYSVKNNDYILLNGQTNINQNGIYHVTADKVNYVEDDNYFKVDHTVDASANVNLYSPVRHGQSLEGISGALQNGDFVFLPNYLQGKQIYKVTRFIPEVVASGITFYDKGTAEADVYPTFRTGVEVNGQVLANDDWLNLPDMKTLLQVNNSKHFNPKQVIGYDKLLRSQQDAVLKAPITNDYAEGTLVAVQAADYFRMVIVGKNNAYFQFLLYPMSVDISTISEGSYIFDSATLKLYKKDGNNRVEVPTTAVYKSVDMPSDQYLYVTAFGYTLANDVVVLVESGVNNGIYTFNDDNSDFTKVAIETEPKEVAGTGYRLQHRYTPGATITDEDENSYTVTTESRIFVEQFGIYKPQSALTILFERYNAKVSPQQIEDGDLQPALAIGQTYGGKEVQDGDSLLLRGYGATDGLYTIGSDGYAVSKYLSVAYVHNTNFDLTPSNMVLGGTIGDHTIASGSVIVLSAQSDATENGIYTFSDLANTSPSYSQYNIIAPTNIDVKSLVAGDLVPNTSQILTEGARVLLVGQNDKVENGIYIIPAATTDGTNPMPIRADDLPDGGSALGICVYDRHKDMIYVCSNDNMATVGTHSLEFISTTGDFVTLTNDQSVAGKKTFSDQVTIGDSTESSSSESGALIVAGGAGFGGNVTAKQFVSVSDIAFKTNISELNDPLRKIKQLNGYTYTWKGDNSKQTQSGLLAQEVKSTDMGHVVHGNKSLSIDYNAIIPYLIESIKSLDEKIEKLN